MKHAWIVVLALAACGKKKEAPKPEPEPAKVVDAAAPAIDAAAAPPAPAPVQLTAGEETELGCVGWSPRLEAAACFTGVTGLGVDHDVALRYIGGTKVPPVAVAETLVDKVVTGANAYLTEHAFVALAPGVALTTDKPLTIGGATFAWKRTETAPAGDNQPPTYKDELTITCEGGKVDPMITETEGGDLEVTLHDQGTRVLMVKKMHVGREGEQSDNLEAAVIDGRLCGVVTD